jgi:hypothetical protein
MNPIVIRLFGEPQPLPEVGQRNHVGAGDSGAEDESRMAQKSPAIQNAPGRIVGHEMESLCCRTLIRAATTMHHDFLSRESSVVFARDRTSILGRLPTGQSAEQQTRLASVDNGGRVAC